MVYYKWYPVVDGKVKIELIDNPFTNRPNDKGFNGWISDTQNTLITFDYDNYKRYAIITPTKNGDKYNDIILNLHASWINARVSYISSNDWNSVFNNFDDKKLQKVQAVKRVCDEYDMTGYYYQKKPVIVNIIVVITRKGDIKIILGVGKIAVHTMSRLTMNHMMKIIHIII